ncbi:LysR family transcriptional regulator [Chachezhania sediminis]|uniref:LysR family transcriptional regulator n=1 Tax=Chachezhania sediminis TaxID=2599291 RepID=UPI00131A9BCB|nr:LysR family transcriptional regulator [Chachezhania sediminis]
MRRPDLNILVILCAVYREGSVTRAAERLNLTQSAISHGLGRLRLLFDDPLFVRKGNRLVSTPLAKRLAEEAREGLERLEALFDQGTEFDPTANARTFTLGVRDVLEASLIPPLVDAMLEEAGQVSLVSAHVQRSAMATRLASGAIDATVDVCLEQPEEVLSERILEEEFCVVARRDHPLACHRHDLSAYLACDHVLISVRQEGDGFEDSKLRRLGHRRQIKLRCQHYLAAYNVVRQSDLVATMPRRLAEMFSDSDGVDLLPVPFEIGRMDFHLYWHASRDADPGNQWFRQMVRRAVRVRAAA